MCYSYKKLIKMDTTTEAIIIVLCIFVFICLCGVQILKYRARVKLIQFQIKMKNRLAMIDIEPVIHENIENYEEKV